MGNTCSNFTDGIVEPFEDQIQNPDPSLLHSNKHPNKPSHHAKQILQSSYQSKSMTVVLLVLFAGCFLCMILMGYLVM